MTYHQLWLMLSHLIHFSRMIIALGTLVNRALFNIWAFYFIHWVLFLIKLVSRNLSLLIESFLCSCINTYTFV